MTINDRQVRATVWRSTVEGRPEGQWRVEVYVAARRWAGTSLVLRAYLDQVPGTQVIREGFDDRLEALDWARRTVGDMRVQLALVELAKRSTYSTEQLAAAWAKLGQVGLEPGGAP